ncbi:MAG: hypothetical protein A2131_01875 [Candidatus Sungbacteria bacterium GWC2_49_10]|uniref:Uncharacterized protein n=2 Tax=Parcubacteria group TaxID=1794811 RepID=A0A0G1Z227_9BACT|nr:MAG: hypothetical protein UY60_C0012G0011 [Parcubacteria group bacterium GW2011_GWB1_50_9]KKW21402.1 MAG: hypothetical protein UY61_C0007G0011 [Candidatus Adlerbacteria bacterium GW2011_GWC1_50_9]OGZ93056.1 MAG: hypothetical protein A2131_01875 [Candidatus Sungbacteria bacterium GWC2_49_10]
MKTDRKIFADPWNAAIIAGVVLLLAIGIALATLRVLPRAEEAPRGGQNTPEMPQNPSPGGEPEARIIGESEFMGAVIRYTATGFAPAQISLTRDNAAETECLIKLQNDTDEELIVRLGPPQEKDNRGFLYSAIAPKKSGIIDPRYSGIFEEEFYNRKNPAHIFSVLLSGFCFQ